MEVGEGVAGSDFYFLVFEFFFESAQAPQNSLTIDFLLIHNREFGDLRVVDRMLVFLRQVFEIALSLFLHFSAKLGLDFSLEPQTRCFLKNSQKRKFT